MNAIQNSIPGIRKIAIVSCELLPPNVELKGISGIPVAILTDTTDISFFGTPEVSTKASYDNNAYVYTSSLKFSSSVEIPLTRKLAFVYTTIDGTSYLIGARERPYPTIEINTTTGKPNGDAKVYTYTITWSSSSKPVRTT